jgi:hypothetical protein
MRFIRKPEALAPPTPLDDDPLSGVANLFDISIALIVALLVALFGMFSSTSALDPSATVTTLIETRNGGVEMITKDKSGITIHKSTDEKASGNGTRLGVAYRLSSGEVVYVPEKK